MSREPVLELIEVSKVYSRGVFRRSLVRAVERASIELSRGEVVSIVGESGSGKTTLGKIAAGLLLPTSGEVRWLGHTVSRDGSIVDREFFRSHRHKFVYIPQDPYSALNPSMTVWTTLDTVVKRHHRGMGSGERLSYIKSLLDRVGLTPPDYFLNKYPHHLSGGMRQRLIIARALAVEPILMVADEVVSMVDPSIRVSIVNLLREISREYSISIIFISHDLGVAMYAAGESGRLYVMLNGLIVESGTSSEVMYDPRHPYTRALIANIPLPMVTTSRSGGRRVRPPELIRQQDPVSLKTTRGCPFASLCPYYESLCEGGLTYIKISGTHYSLCRKAESLPAWRPGWAEGL